MKSIDRLVFAGTPEFASTILLRMIDAGVAPVAIYTQPDRRSGRGKKLSPSSVKTLGLHHEIPVEQPENFREAATIERLADYRPDLVVVAAYGLILPGPVLSLPVFGCVNVHASLLPRWRGAAPVERAIEAGDTYSGVTIMQMDEGLDTGHMLLGRPLALLSDETGRSLRRRLAELGGELLLDALSLLRHEAVQPRPQPDSGVLYAAKLHRDEARIDWSKEAPRLALRVRAFVDANVCFSELEGSRVRFWAASALDLATDQMPGAIISADESGIVVACGSGALRIEQLQLPGGRVMAAAELLNAKRQLFRPGLCFEPS